MRNPNHHGNRASVMLAALASLLDDTENDESCPLCGQLTAPCQCGFLRHRPNEKTEIHRCPLYGQMTAPCRCGHVHGDDQ